MSRSSFRNWQHPVDYSHNSNFSEILKDSLMPQESLKALLEKKRKKKQFFLKRPGKEYGNKRKKKKFKKGEINKRDETGESSLWPFFIR
ncbi:hypothetical protein TNIN_151721 [Trichonephila inaurata madagascariensis]|uniref:Uncharacterized protein n=1 Tax=Trichonephila inaurata madagascariensis TaxID=2747483 RepID=A0A8X6WSB3_9ARAC|nr:hypothetical protein TNIN_151721 [Trichonephila inaurata madagascariensis]